MSDLVGNLIVGFPTKWLIYKHFGLLNCAINLFATRYIWKKFIIINISKAFIYHDFPFLRFCESK